MRDKYERCFHENEGKGSKIEKLKGYLLRSKYHLQILKKAGYQNYKFISDWNINFIVISLSMMNEEWQQIIVDHVISYLNKETLMLTYVNQCCCFATMNKDKEIDTVMASFKKSGLIKDIKYDKEKHLFELITLEDKNIKFTSEFCDKDSIEKYNSQCHMAVEALCHHVDGIYATTGIMKNYFGKKYYHSFIIKDDLVHDFAQNIIMPFEDYKKIFGYESIIYIDGKELLKNIEVMKEQDKEYQENDMCDVLKYALHKQMTRKYS